VAYADATMALAEAEGATVLPVPKDEFHGDGTGQVVDPFGHRWMIATRGAPVVPKEMQRRWTAVLAG
jgi:PhnB protein